MATLLVADDLVPIRQMVRITLSTQGWTILEAKNGTEALEIARKQKPDLILLDPPRSGCHPDLLGEIARRHIPRIVYVSCDPSTLARDIKALAGTYRLSAARVVDMFPQTFHLETVAVLDSV
jgi:23S rRNA (uracil1939-C5)-methyltransferase